MSCRRRDPGCERRARWRGGRRRRRGTRPSVPVHDGRAEAQPWTSAISRPPNFSLHSFQECCAWVQLQGWILSLFKGTSGGENMRGVVAGLAGVILAATALIGQYPASAQDSLDRVNHIIVIYQENWSFDALYGKFPGANGFANAGPVAIQQVDKDNRPYPTLPQPINRRLTPPAPDSRFPTDLPNEPFNLAHFIQPTEIPGSPIHEFYREQHQINGGKLNKFVAWTDVGGLVMSYYDATNWPMGRLAQRFTLADNFFHAAF